MSKSRIPDQFIQKYDLILTEENAGFSDHKFHNKLTEDVLTCWVDSIKELTPQTSPIKDCENLDDLNYTKTVDLKTLEVYEGEYRFLEKYSLECVVYVEESDNVIVRGKTEFDPSKKEMVYISITLGSKFTPSFILKQNEKLKAVAAHEVTHFIKHIYGTYQKGLDAFKKKNRPIDKKQYLSYKHEYQANITKINSELKTISNKYANISFTDSLKLSQTWREYDRYVFDVDKKLKVEMLKKILKYWKTNLGRKL